jgi:hypothetical protein
MGGPRWPTNRASFSPSIEPAIGVGKDDKDIDRACSIAIASPALAACTTPKPASSITSAESIPKQELVLDNQDDGPQMLHEMSVPRTF